MKYTIEDAFKLCLIAIEYTDILSFKFIRHYKDDEIFDPMTIIDIELKDGEHHYFSINDLDNLVDFIQSFMYDEIRITHIIDLQDINWANPPLFKLENGNLLNGSLLKGMSYEDMMIILKNSKVLVSRFDVDDLIKKD